MTHPVIYMWQCGSVLYACDYVQALFAFELQRRLGKEGVTSCAMEPGGVASPIWNGTIFGKPPFRQAIDMVSVCMGACACGYVRVCVCVCVCVLECAA